MIFELRLYIYTSSNIITFVKKFGNIMVHKFIFIKKGGTGIFREDSVYDGTLLTLLNSIMRKSFQWP